MRFSNSVLSTLATSLLTFSATEASSCETINGNYYCSSVSAVQYQGLGFSGTYQEVTSMDESSCACSQSSVAFSGNMSPLDEELSVHFRGPINLKQFGVYYPSGATHAKRDEGTDCTTTKHVHHQHKRAPVIEYTEVTKTVYQDAEGNIINYIPAGQTIASDESAVLTTLQTSTTDSNDATTADEDTTSTSTATTAATGTTTSSIQVASSTASTGNGWVRSSYYSSSGTSDNLVFMNNEGGTAGSGVWSSCFGNSISYAASNGVDGASSSQILDDVTLTSDQEFMIFSGTECSDTSVGDCGYYRGDIPAYHGFVGADKVFVFEFQMPAATGDSSVSNYDMPAVWLLNAKIPRTLQYGSADCSCWSTGCGELDLFEVLSSGDGADKMANHLHDGQGASSGSNSGGGGTSDYIERPYDSTMKAAVIFKDTDVTIVVLDDDTTFDSSFSSDVIDGWIDTDASVATLV